LDDKDRRWPKLQATVKTMDFILREMMQHQRVLSRDMAGPNSLFGGPTGEQGAGREAVRRLV
jgi:hypothetical protein